MGEQGRQKAGLCKGPVTPGSRVARRGGTGEAAGMGQVLEQTPESHS